MKFSFPINLACEIASKAKEDSESRDEAWVYKKVSLARALGATEVHFDYEDICLLINSVGDL